MKNKKILYGLVAGLVLLGGAGTFAVLNQPKPTTVATSETSTASVSSTQVTTSVNAVASELSSKLNNEVTVETNVAELEQQLSTITDEKVREELTKKLEEVKQVHAVKVADQPKDEQPQSRAVVKADETSQPVQPAQNTSQANPTPQPQTTQRPVETTRQTTRQTTQATTKRHIIIGGMGNSGREFKTQEEANAWAYPKMGKQGYGNGYFVLPIVYSDGTETYTIDWY